MHARFATALVSTLTLFSGLSWSAAPPPSFEARHVLELGNAVIALGDFNKDGRSDILSVVSTPNSPTNNYQAVINLNVGNGVFQAGQTIDLGPNFVPSAAVTGDFNKDGLLDFAVYSANAQALYVAVQGPGKKFEIVLIQITGYTYTPPILAVGDLNGDGLPDIVVPNQNGVAVVFSQGKARFSTPTYLPFYGAQSVAIGDFNGDKIPDLVINAGQCCSFPSAVVFLSDGKGGFNPAPVNQTLSYTVGPIALGDFNRDGKLDVAAAASAYNYGLEIAYGAGDGSFSSISTVTLPSEFPTGYGVAGGDLDGDGYEDLSLLAGGANNTSVFSILSTGPGSFSVSVPYPVQTNATNIMLGALNKDKLADVLVSSVGVTQAVSLLLNTGSGMFQDGVVVATALPPTALAAADFNNDQKLDLVGISTSLGLTTFLNNGTASIFTALTPLPIYGTAVVASDVNGDGRADVVVANQATGQVLVGRGDGTFLYQPPTFNLGYTSNRLGLADMNNDGKPDLVTNTPAIALGTGNGKFSPAAISPTYCYNPSSAFGIADFNQDGKLDVVTSCYGTLFVNFGNGDGTLQYNSFIANNNVQSAAVGDFNRDGIADIVFTSNPNFYPPVSSQATILIGIGNGTFSYGQTVLVGTGYSGFVTTADFNGDGIVDIAVLDDTNSVVSILQGVGDGTFLNPVSFGAGTSPTCMVAGRFQPHSTKGKADLAFCSGQGISLDLNNTQ